MEKLQKQYDKLQKEYGSKELNSVYGCGKQYNPRVAQLPFQQQGKKSTY